MEITDPRVKLLPVKKLTVAQRAKLVKPEMRALLEATELEELMAIHDLTHKLMLERPD